MGGGDQALGQQRPSVALFATQAVSSNGRTDANADASLAECLGELGRKLVACGVHVLTVTDQANDALIQADVVSICDGVMIPSENAC